MQEADLLHQITFSVTWPPSTTFGVGAVAGLGDRAKARGAKRALLVTDAGLVRAGLAERVAAILRASGVDVHIFSEVRPNPTMAEVTEGVSLLRRDRFDLLVALGGGSSIDASKVMSMQLLSNRSIEEIEARGSMTSPARPSGSSSCPARPEPAARRQRARSSRMPPARSTSCAACAADPRRRSWIRR